MTVRRISYAWMAIAAALALYAPAAEGARKGPDLSVAQLALSGSPAPGQAFSAQVTVKNAGKAKAKGSQTAVVLSKDGKRSKDDRTLSSPTVKALAARKTAKAALRLTIPAATAPGRYTLIACADARAKVKETS